MRWYCVSPALPKGAQLRVRTAPSASAPESSSHRLNIYDVVSTSSPPLKAPWLQVAWQQSEGYVMASTPDEMPLLVPWESTSFVKVVFVYPETELRHQTTHESVVLELDAYLGVVSVLAADSDDVSYVVMYQGEPYIVEQVDAVIMAERIHESMRFAMNPDLPENATIVVRQWPHRDSDQVDVLTHGQEINGDIRSEDWIKIHEHAWVMWKLASHHNLELLQPVQATSHIEPVEENVQDDTTHTVGLPTESEDNPPSHHVNGESDLPTTITCDKVAICDDVHPQERQTYADRCPTITCPDPSHPVIHHQSTAWDDRPIHGTNEPPCDTVASSTTSNVQL
ncbi:hypothetical protein AaE_004689, partial [Aphanomyces astaci]